MKNLFRGHFAQDNENLKTIWNDCYFVFDANFLLNLYKYSDSTRDVFLHILESVKDKIWLPHRAVDEYLNKRAKIIIEESRSYENTISDINKLEQSFKNSRKHPFISEEIKARTEEVFELLRSELNESKKNHFRRIQDDHIKEKLALLFEGRVGEPFSKDELKKILDDCEVRFLEKIPPGFADANKLSGKQDSKNSSERDRCRVCGDYLVWVQILQVAKSAEKNVIFVTDDSKADWWEITDKVTIGPRPELIVEFFQETKKQFFMYKSDQFLNLAKESLKEPITDEIMNEVRDFANADEIVKEVIDFAKKEYNVDLAIREEAIPVLNKRLMQIQGRMQELDSQLKDYDHLLNGKREQLKNQMLLDADSIIVEQLKKELKMLEKSRSKYQQELDELNTFFDPGYAKKIFSETFEKLQ